jgi:putative zinc finger protein
MTAHDRALDELVSAYLDGEATAEEAARVEGDPELQARLAEFAATRDAVRATVSGVTDDARDALLARVVGTVIAPPNVVPLHRRRVAPAKVLAVAAAVVAIAFIGGAITLLANDQRDSETSASDDSGGAIAMSIGEDAASATTGAPTADGGAAASPTPADQYPSLGEFSDVAALQGRLDEALEQAPVETTTAQEGRDAMSTPQALACETGVAVVYRAVLAGQPVLVLVGDETVTVLADGDCSIVTSFAR